MKKKICYYVVIALFFMLLPLQSLGTVFAQASASNGENDKLAEIKRAGQIVLGVSADYKPYEFHAIVDRKDRIVGFDVAIAQAIADALGVKLVMKEMDFSGLLAALQTGTVDIVVSGMQATEERKKNIDFSIPYFKEKNVFITKATDLPHYNNTQDLVNKKIGVQQGTTQERAAEDLKSKVPSMIIQPIGSLLDMLQQTKNDSIDGIIIGDTVAEVALQKSPELAMVPTISIASDDAGFSVGVAKGNQSLVTFINGVISELINTKKIPQMMSAALAYEEQEAQHEQKAGNSFDFLKRYTPMLLKGTAMTIIIAFFSVIFGVIGGTLLALMRLSDYKVLRMLATAYVDFIRGTPMLIQIYIIFYGLPALGIRLPAIVTGILAMSFNSASYVAEIIRAGIGAVDKGQFEAAASLGMKRGLMMKEIILPQALKNILPALGNEFITIIKESSILSVISIADLMFVANTIRGNTFQAFTPLIVVAIIYFVLTFTLSKGLRFLERRLNKNV